MMTQKFKFITLLILALGLNWPVPSLAYKSYESSPKVVVSITPFYGLVAYIMQGVGTPVLLVNPGSSPHQYVLTPKNTQLLKQADIIFWGGPELETFLVKSLDNLEGKHSETTRIVQLNKTLGLLLLPLRQSSAWDPHQHAHSDLLHSHSHAPHGSSHVDMHFWLDTHNALIIANTIAHSLLSIDPTHADIYRKNIKTLKSRLEDLNDKIKLKLEPLKKVPFIVFHDAYQYFEHQYGLNGVGSITLHPEIPPSAKRLQTIRDIIGQTKARCVFTEPQFQPKLVQSITEDLSVKIGELDPVGNNAENNPEGYFRLIENLADSMASCLK